MNIFFRKSTCLLLILLLELNYRTLLAQNRIIGGKTISIQGLPYMLRLQTGRKGGGFGVCGASIIGHEWGLTAAHCFKNADIDYNKITVIAGTASLSNWARTAKKHNVTRVILHANYKKNTRLGNDIAVIKISPPLIYNKAIQPVKLPIKGQALKTSFGTVSGWGHIKPGGPGSGELLFAMVPKVNINKCKEMYLTKGLQLKPGEICYGFKNATVVYDKCQGDSGGPLVNADWIEIGLVSWGIECGIEGFPGIYTDVLYFRDWIKQKTGI